MKVKYKLVIALALAVPFTLVSADELVINDNDNALVLNRADYSMKLQETVTITPVDFKDVTVAPPSLDEAAFEVTVLGSRPKEAPVSKKVAYSDTVAGGGF